MTLFFLGFIAGWIVRQLIDVDIVIIQPTRIQTLKIIAWIVALTLAVILLKLFGVIQ